MNDKKRMFRPKSYGWGISPNNAQGWLFILVWLILFVAPLMIVSVLTGAAGLAFVITYGWLMIGVVSLVVFTKQYLKKYYPEYWRKK